MSLRDVAEVDTGGGDPDQDLARTRDRDRRVGDQAQVLRAVAWRRLRANRRFWWPGTGLWPTAHKPLYFRRFLGAFWWYESDFPMQDGYHYCQTLLAHYRSLPRRRSGEQ